MSRLQPCVATIGFFDGVHMGHRYLIDRLKETACQEHLLSTVITFERHPRQVLSPSWHPQLLTTLDEKTVLLSQTGIDQLVVLSFDAAMAALSARRFMADILYQQLGVQTLVTGYDNRFGHRAEGKTEGFDDYVAYGRELGMTVIQGDALVTDNIRVSSSKIRQMLLAGDVSLAVRCLGRPYELSGVVVDGQHVGTGLGFPTANLQLDDPDKLIPSPGVYAVKVRVNQSMEWKHGMMNIGNRPTFNGHHQTLETHIFCFDDSIYGQSMTVSFISRLRSEMRFDSRESLALQLAVDARQAEEILKQTEI